MFYEKLGFEKGQVLKADHLNHMEEGIAKAGVYVVKTNEDFTQVLTPLNDIVDAALNGTPVYIFRNNIGIVEMYTLMYAQPRGDNGNLWHAKFISVGDGDIHFVSINETGEISIRKVLFETYEDEGK